MHPKHTQLLRLMCEQLDSGSMLRSPALQGNEADGAGPPGAEQAADPELEAAKKAERERRTAKVRLIVPDPRCDAEHVFRSTRQGWVIERKEDQSLSSEQMISTGRAGCIDDAFL